MGSNSAYNVNKEGIEVLVGSSLLYDYEVLVEQQKYLPQLKDGQEASYFSSILTEHLLCALLRIMDLAVGTINKVFPLTEPTFLMVR